MKLYWWAIGIIASLSQGIWMSLVASGNPAIKTTTEIFLMMLWTSINVSALVTSALMLKDSDKK